MKKYPIYHLHPPLNSLSKQIVMRIIIPKQHSSNSKKTIFIILSNTIRGLFTQVMYPGSTRVATRFIVYFYFVVDQKNMT